MKVKCVKRISATTGKERTSDHWLTIGKMYTVLSIFVDQHGINYRLMSDDGRTPALFESCQFTVVSGKIPSNWIVNYQQCALKISPEIWTRDGFWEEFFEGNPEAVEEFEKERMKIVTETS